MNQSSKSGHKQNQVGKYSTSLSDEFNHSLNNGTALSLQSFVDDIPFEFNPKYRPIYVPNVNIPEYDTTKICNILDAKIDFTLENKVVAEALEDLQRKKKEIEQDILRQQSSSIPQTVTINCQRNNLASISSNSRPENIHFPATLVPSPTLQHMSNIQPTVPLPASVTSYSLTPILPVPPILTVPPIPPATAVAPIVTVSAMPPTNTISPSSTAKPSVSPSYRLPSVRDIYWPTGNQQHYAVPVTTPSIIASNILNLPTPIRSTNSSPDSVKQNAQSFNNCDSKAANDLAATFDGTLGSNDPFHDAELKSLNDVAELRHLYSAIGSANTVRR